jgi:hypothetical protein
MIHTGKLAAIKLSRRKTIHRRGDEPSIGNE